MTTHETQPETRTPMEQTQARHAGPEAAPAETLTPMEQTPARDAGPDAAPPETLAPTETTTPTTNLDNDQVLFEDTELSGLRSRWTDVQSSFVDDPRDCVQKADGLVADVVEKLTSQFSHARSQLEGQWDRGEEVSTEDLRIALKRYREFFERLLAV